MRDVVTRTALRKPDQQRLVLLATSISYVLVILDTSIVNVALESISTGLSANLTGLQWIVTAYVAVFASLVLSGGALGDMFGARRVYLVGLSLFTLSSLLMSCAPSLAVLIAGRVLQGIGAALLVPCALSLLTHAYTEPAARARAIASWAAWGGAALVLGPLVGGALLAVFDWRSIFLVNVPIGGVGIWLTLQMPALADDRGSRRLDLPGQISAALALLLMVGGLIEGGEVGWRSRLVLAMFIIAALAVLTFIVVERRSRAPMLPLRVFSNPVLTWVVAVMLCGAAAFSGMLFVLNLFFLQGAGYSPLRTGMAMLPLAACATAGNLAAARLAHRLDPLGIMIIGAAIRLPGFVGIALASTMDSYPWFIVPLLLIGLGSGLSNPMAMSVLLSATDRRYAGVTSGLATATGQLGAAIGVAVFGAFLLDTPHIADGTRLAALASASVSLVILLTIVQLRRHLRRTSP